MRKTYETYCRVEESINGVLIVYDAVKMRHNNASKNHAATIQTANILLESPTVKFVTVETWLITGEGPEDMMIMKDSERRDYDEKWSHTLYF